MRYQKLSRSSLHLFENISKQIKIFNNQFNTTITIKTIYRISSDFLICICEKLHDLKIYEINFCDCDSKTGVTRKASFRKQFPGKFPVLNDLFLI